MAYDYDNSTLHFYIFPVLEDQTGELSLRFIATSKTPNLDSKECLHKQYNKSYVNKFGLNILTVSDVVVVLLELIVHIVDTYVYMVYMDWSCHNDY